MAGVEREKDVMGIKVVCVKDRKAMEALPFDKCRIAVFMVGNCTGGCGSEGCRGTENYIVQISDWIDEALGVTTIGAMYRVDQDDEHRYPYSLLRVSHCDCAKGYSKEKLKKFIENKFLLGLSLQFENWEDLPE